MPIIKFIFPNFICILSELGLAMIQAASKGYEKQTVEVVDIIALSRS